MRRSAGPARAAEWAHRGPEADPNPGVSTSRPLADPGASRSGLGPLEPEDAPIRPAPLASSRKAAPAETVRVPLDPVNEQVILAVAIVSAEHRTRLLAQFSPDYFFAKGHAEIWTTLGESSPRRRSWSPTPSPI